MDLEKLEKANGLAKNIRNMEEALLCFEWTTTNNGEPKTISTNPQIIIEYDEDGREQIRLPIMLNKEFIGYMKEWIKTNLAEARKEFKEL